VEAVVIIRMAVNCKVKILALVIVLCFFICFSQIEVQVGTSSFENRVYILYLADLPLTVARNDYIKIHILDNSGLPPILDPFDNINNGYLLDDSACIRLFVSKGLYTFKDYYLFGINIHSKSPPEYIVDIKLNNSQYRKIPFSKLRADSVIFTNSIELTPNEVKALRRINSNYSFDGKNFEGSLFVVK
jgi:hypothetical protein